jgi:hypothetical protein
MVCSRVNFTLDASVHTNDLSDVTGRSSERGYSSKQYDPQRNAITATVSDHV